MLSLNNISVIREDVVLKNISIDFLFNQIYGVIGKSGAGKTTLLKAMSGLVELSGGEVIFDGEKLIGPSQKLIPGYDEIQLVNQDFAVEPYHTVYENVKDKVLSRHEEDQAELVEEYLNLVELSDIKSRKAYLLSGGEQQRLSIARALASEPKVLLLDEPFVHIDQRLRRKILHYLKDLQEVRKMLLVMVSHDGSELMGFANEIIYISGNQILRQGPTSEVYYYPKTKEEGMLLGDVNEVIIDGEKIFFRPSQYSFNNPNINVQYVGSEDTGLTILNYFELDNKTEIILSSRTKMTEVKKIRITE
tara:strand:- start:212 stop:1126 length:915 start_codon:yes stop_codon:yes gene_type:complete